MWLISSNLIFLRLLILKALPGRVHKVFARGVLASAQKIDINIYTKPLHRVFDAAQLWDCLHIILTYDISLYMCQGMSFDVGVCRCMSVYVSVCHCMSLYVVVCCCMSVCQCMWACVCRCMSVYVVYVVACRCIKLYVSVC